MKPTFTEEHDARVSTTNAESYGSQETSGIYHGPDLTLKGLSYTMADHSGHQNQEHKLTRPRIIERDDLLEEIDKIRQKGDKQINGDVSALDHGDLR